MKSVSTYEQQAIDFATKYNVKLSAIGQPEYKYYFSGDKDKRFVFKMKLQRGRNSYTFEFGQSINAGATEPTLYDVLACMQKYDTNCFDDFCSEFGYDEFDKMSKKIYKAVVKEFEAMERLFGDCMEELQEIN